MQAFAAALESSAPAWLIGETEWLYPLVNTAHVLGIALLFGAIVVLDLRLLGAWRTVPVSLLAGPTVRVAGAGTGLALLSGGALFAAQATDYVDNPMFYLKLGAVAAGLVNVLLLHRSDALGRSDPTRAAAVGAAVSLVCWLTAITAGRWIAYW